MRGKPSQKCARPQTPTTGYRPRRPTDRRNDPFAPVSSNNVVMSTTVVIERAKEMREWSRARRAEGKKVAFVPTMGALHEGHLTLLDVAKTRGDVVVMSIYVNPKQFAPGEDFDAYPRVMEGDLAAARARGATCVFAPKEMYVDASVGDVPPHETTVEVNEMSKGLCAITRPHFFRGVATVVTKLFNVVEPDVAVFGKKDYQQWRVIRRMVRDLDFDIEIVGGEIVRESDGLAMSSRNLLLTPEKRAEAVVINQSLRKAKELAETEKNVESERLVAMVRDAINGGGGVVDYVEAVHPETLKPYNGVVISPCVMVIAAKFGQVRLLDNIEIMFG